jgi:hypothetical protein
MGKLTLGLGLGVGYVLGARAGRGRFEQIKKSAAGLAERPEVQQAVEKVRAAAPAQLQSTIDGLTGHGSGGAAASGGAASDTAPSGGAPSGKAPSSSGGISEADLALAADPLDSETAPVIAVDVEGLATPESSPMPEPPADSPGRGV